MNAKQKIDAIRQWMKEQDLAAYILPMADEYLSEYVPPHAMRLAWLTGFDGSAGTAVITPNKAALFTDGRYTIQAAQQLDSSLFEIHNITKTKLSDWLINEVKTQPVGVDAMLLSPKQITALTQIGVNMIAVPGNPVDIHWKDRPAAANVPAWEYPLEYAGKSSADKRREIAEALRLQGTDALLICAAENIAWLLNIRGGDLECTPVVQAYALLYSNGDIQLFCASDKLPADVIQKLNPIEILSLTDITTALNNLKGKALMVCHTATPAALVTRAEQAGACLITTADPIEQAKAIKNETELKHMRQVHIKDGAALSKSLMQIDTWIGAGKMVDELTIDQLLHDNRAAVDGFISLSFPAIVGAGEHGAIVHYRVTEQSNRQVSDGELLLIDSGGQYLGGTTDVTRTLATGTPTAQQKKHYTLVLKGHIALARAIFPEGTPGSQLDVLARQFLWAHGTDYDHGTGHGVGACLNVHEGPQRISKRGDQIGLKAGMILSNEPGYYEEGAYGIRIENLVEVVQKQPGFLGFENLTQVPYARTLIDVALLSPAEIDYINHYHQTVLEHLAPHMNDAQKTWLTQTCAPL